MNDRIEKGDINTTAEVADKAITANTHGRALGSLTKAVRALVVAAGLTTGFGAVGCRVDSNDYTIPECDVLGDGENCDCSTGDDVLEPEDTKSNDDNIFTDGSSNEDTNVAHDDTSTGDTNVPHEDTNVSHEDTNVSHEDTNTGDDNSSNPEVLVPDTLNFKLDFQAKVVIYKDGKMINMGTFQPDSTLALSKDLLDENGLLLAWIFNSSNFIGELDSLNPSTEDYFISNEYYHQNTPPAVGTLIPTCNPESIATSIKVQPGHAEMVTFGCPK